MNGMTLEADIRTFNGAARSGALLTPRSDCARLLPVSCTSSLTEPGDVWCGSQTLLARRPLWLLTCLCSLQRHKRDKAPRLEAERSAADGCCDSLRPIRRRQLHFVRQQLTPRVRMLPHKLLVFMNR